MDPRDCVDALTSVDGRFQDCSPCPLEGGWSFWTFFVDGFVVRFPRTPEDARLLEREMRLLAGLRGRLPVHVPSYELSGRWHGLPFGAYPFLDGETADAAMLGDPEQALIQDVGRVLATLHAFPIEEASRLLEEPPGTGWGRTQRFIDECRARVFPLLPAASERAVQRGLAVMGSLAEQGSMPECLTHNDFGPAHLLTARGRLSAVIDWSDAELGDPARDFVAVFGAGGWAAVSGALEAGGVPVVGGFKERVEFFAWLAPCHDVTYALRIGDPDILQFGLDGITSRLRSAGLRD